LQAAATNIKFLSLPKSFHIHLIFVVCSTFTVSLALFIRRDFSMFPIANGAQLMDVAAFQVTIVSPGGEAHGRNLQRETGRRRRTL